MKTLIVILLCLFASDTFAQSYIVATKADTLLLTKKNTKLLTLGSGLTVSGDTISAGGGGGGTFENWSATGAGSPVQAPTVGGAGQLAMLDSGSATGYKSINIANNSQTTGIGGLTLATNKAAFAPNINSGLFGILIATGLGNTLGSAGTCAFGYNTFDGCTINSFANDSHGNVGGGYNTLLGPNVAINGALSNFNTAVGYGATINNGRSNVALGDGAFITGSSNVYLGSQTGINDVGTAHYRIEIYSQDTTFNGNSARHDSVVVLGGRNLITNNVGQVLFGSANVQSGTTHLLTGGSGGFGTNGVTFNAIDVDKDGTIAAGKNFKSTLRTITTSSDTGTQGEICYDANFIYICVNTNTWKRVAIATW